MMVFTLAQRELRTLFLSPLAWSILAVMQFILAYLFLTSLNDFINLQPRLQNLESPPGATELVVAQVYGSAAFIFMMVVPLLTMRVISEERRNRSIALLFSAPLSMTEIVLGKYLGLLGFLLLACLMISLMPLSLLFAGPLDLGLLLAMFLALFLLSACFAAIGLFLSTLTLQPTIAAISTFGALLLLWIIDWAGDQAGDIDASGVLEYLSILRHFEPLSRGLFSSTDILYFLLFITVFLVLSIRRLDADRLQH
ncbi:ABC transporter permease subunit [Thiohalophilus thiocyanatoxydans]|uniref:ABC-2 type transport system permease protein n=1 Tax=Thiohalophilus thiocyanatoxydans TaxID=381308 RepID=A0A4R8ISU2_9GAMM|nr:ABC transporter permease subunit [Thiohalophilus thiocyanatoxydans]TDY04121.1 ABC-2 type transport system permease protein [Thiohalophilus thiocyanatoxydans]